MVAVACSYDSQDDLGCRLRRRRRLKRAPVEEAAEAPVEETAVEETTEAEKAE